MGARLDRGVLAIGQTIDRYTVEAVIGQGGMAVVYRVRHTRLGSRHALKVLSVARPNVRKRLLREGRVQAELHHPNVVSVSDVLDVNGTPALLMEYVDGPSLEWVLQRKKLTLNEKLAVFRAVCSGVAEAHQRGLVHRDLKPSNVLLARRSDGVIPKVTDFGIAKLIQGTTSPSATGSQVAMGTPSYMAPEQIRDARSVDQRADIFSLGAMLYELSTGRRPFDGPDVLAILNSVASASYQPPLERCPDLPPHIAGVIDGCLIVDPEQRLPDAFTLIDRIGGREGLNGRTIPLVALLDDADPATAHLLPPGDPDDDDLALFGNTYGDAEPEDPDDDFFLDPTPPLLPGRGSALSSQSLTDRTPLYAGHRAGIDPDAATVPTPQRRITWVPPRKPASYTRQILMGAALGVVLSALLVVVWIGSGNLGTDDTDPARAPATHLPPEIASRADPVPFEPDLERDTEPLVDADPGPGPSPARGFETRPRFEREPDGFLFADPPPDGPDPSSPIDPEPGRVIVSGDAHSSRLIDGFDSFPPGSIPPGSYEIEVSFTGEASERIGTVNVASGQIVKVICFADDHRCTIP